jgi:hypothetical protein
MLDLKSGVLNYFCNKYFVEKYKDVEKSELYAIKLCCFSFQLMQTHPPYRHI